MKKALNYSVDLRINREEKKTILAGKLILCDEFAYLDKECFEEEVVEEYIKGRTGKIFIGIGDFKQIVPVVRGRSIEKIKMLHPKFCMLAII